MRRLATAALAICLSAALPAQADEFTEVIESALEAYRDGDINVAREELDYAMKLLTELKAAGLAEYLPQPLAGWTREMDDAAAGGMGMAMFGGGSAASATYTRGTEEFTITLVANSPMVSGMAAMFSGMAAMSGGRTIRVQRQQFHMNEDELQGVVGGKVLITIAGDASLEDKQAHLEAMDLRSLGEF